MATEIILAGNITISDESPTFIIAEIGQNHQGDINIAKQLITTAKDSGANCVKFQKTCLSEKFNKSALNREYINENSWGSTYGEHKKYLEFCDNEFRELQQYSQKIDVLFTASAMDDISLKFLADICVPFIKIGSGDANNFSLIEKAARMNIPLIISTGMQDFETVTKIYNIVSAYHKRFVIMHCVSSYPTPLEDINLNVIKLYRKEFPDVHVGYSGHEIGSDISPVAVALGAKVIERHITLDHSLRGSDHKCSLEPQEFLDMVKKIRNIEAALGKPHKKRQMSEIPCYLKLGKTIVASIDLPLGHILTTGDIKIKVAEPRGIDPVEIHSILGKKLLKSIFKDESILPENVRK